MSQRCYWTATAAPLVAEPLRGDATAEVAVIGGGITGLSAAYHLTRDHGADVVVLEARTPGWGASGRNAGMVVPSVGKLTIAERLAKWGPEPTRRSGALGVAAVERVSELIADEEIDCDVAPGGWLQVAHRPEAASGLEGAAAAWRDELGVADVEALSAGDMAELGYGRGPESHGAVRVEPAFGMHPLNYVHGLAAAARRRGVRLHADTPVVEWSKRDGVHVLATDAAVLRARRVVIATDAYTPEGLHARLDGRIVATSGALLVTRPLDASEWETTGIRHRSVYTDLRKVLHYWRRLPDDRLLFGGRGPALNGRRALDRHRHWLERRLAAKLPSLAGVGAEYFWTGAISLSLDRVPHVAAVEDDPTVAYAACYLGTGIALSTYWGGHLADLVTGRRVTRDTPMVDRGLRRFPLPALRRQYFNVTRMAYELRDEGVRLPRRR